MHSMSFAGTSTPFAPQTPSLYTPCCQSSHVNASQTLAISLVKSPLSLARHDHLSGPTDLVVPKYQVLTLAGGRASTGYRIIE